MSNKNPTEVKCNQSSLCKIPYCGHKKEHKPQVIFKTEFGQTDTRCNDVALNCPKVGLARCENKIKDGR